MQSYNTFSNFLHFFTKISKILHNVPNRGVKPETKNAPQYAGHSFYRYLNTIYGKVIIIGEQSK